MRILRNLANQTKCTLHVEIEQWPLTGVKMEKGDDFFGCYREKPLSLHKKIIYGSNDFT